MSKGLPYLLGINIPKVKPEISEARPVNFSDYLMQEKPIILPSIKNVSKIIPRKGPTIRQQVINNSPKKINKKPTQKPIVNYIDQMLKMYE